MEHLQERERARQQLELESLGDQLLGQAQGVDNEEIESIASRSATDFRNTGELNIYKPTLKGQTPRMMEPPKKQSTKPVVATAAARRPSGKPPTAKA